MLTNPEFRLAYDSKNDVFCGTHFDVEAAAIESVRKRYLAEQFGVGPELATESQQTEAEQWSLDERNWSLEMAGVVPLHNCGGHG